MGVECRVEPFHAVQFLELPLASFDGSAWHCHPRQRKRARRTISRLQRELTYNSLVSIQASEIDVRPTNVDGVWAAFRQILPFAALLGLAAAIRILANNVDNFSLADETIYLNYVRALAHGGAYRDLIRQFVEDQSLWIFPSPLRWSYLGSGALYCAARGVCRYRILATVSTGCGIAAVALTCWLAVRWFERRTALVATALMVTSPLQAPLDHEKVSK